MPPAPTVLATLPTPPPVRAHPYRPQAARKELAIKTVRSHRTAHGAAAAVPAAATRTHPPDGCWNAVAAAAGALPGPCASSVAACASQTLPLPCHVAAVRPYAGISAAVAMTSMLPASAGSYLPLPYAAASPHTAAGHPRFSQAAQACSVMGPLTPTSAPPTELPPTWPPCLMLPPPPSALSTHRPPQAPVQVQAQSHVPPLAPAPVPRSHPSSCSAAAAAAAAALQAAMAANAAANAAAGGVATLATPASSAAPSPALPPSSAAAQFVQRRYELANIVSWFTIKKWFGPLGCPDAAARHARLRELAYALMIHFRIATSVVVLALHLILRLTTQLNLRAVPPEPGSEIRVLTVALMLAEIQLNDRPYPARLWTKVTRLKVGEVAAMKMEFLQALDWRTHLGADEFAAWVRQLSTYINACHAVAIAKRVA
ncbi:hypothetical protein CXG81DRAFT_23522 [Caulochytrium protostelioides]|uniref:Cyclin N-terminal domain-containing protein n=1 Tax=Caulochytrium protostelioides TaxID=1555241 RepID=A0A4P9XE60_9FUNG|nr:hypothetical protein CXG81DRAFT_23522 [Caulochytrium protostelioides]|eukprot:RKP03827.1 hypothetical protein CXG81DRAFT_23522 [Caulochytrium protostelioides]